MLARTEFKKRWYAIFLQAATEMSIGQWRKELELGIKTSGDYTVTGVTVTNILIVN
jgi:hypothetical protein